MQEFIIHNLRAKFFYKELIDFITRGPLCAVILQGENAVEVIRKTNGATDPSEADVGTIRREFGKDKTENCVHASDSKTASEYEIALWFRNFNNSQMNSQINASLFVLKHNKNKYFN